MTITQLSKKGMPQIEAPWKAIQTKNKKKSKWHNPVLAHLQINDSSDNEEECISPVDICSQDENTTTRNPTHKPTKMDTTLLTELETSESNTQEVTLSSLLSELWDIKITILNLDAKIDTSHQELSSKLIDNKVFYDHISTQDKKITELQHENEELKRHNIMLEKEINKTQEDMLRLKVNIAGIPRKWLRII